MDMKTRQIFEVSKLPNGKYVLCVISVAPRSVVYHHKQKVPFLSYRWMREEDWTFFDNVIEELAFESNHFKEDIKKTVELSPLVHLKIETITSGISQLCQLSNEVKGLKANNIAMAVKCEIEYKEKIVSESNFEHKEKNTFILSNQLLVPACESDKKPNTCLDDDLDQQIQSFHIGQQKMGYLTPVNSSATIGTIQETESATNSPSTIDDEDFKPSDENSTVTRKSARSKKLVAAKQDHFSPPPPPPSARQRRTISKPKRFNEFVMQPKRLSQSPKTELSEDESFEERTTPKRGRKANPDSKSTIKGATNTPLLDKSRQETPRPCSRALFQQDKNRKIEMLSKKESRKNMQELMDELSPPSPPKVKYLSLGDLTVNQVMSTLFEIKPCLDAIFKEIKGKDYVKSHNGINHFLVIELISDKIKSEMMKKLGELYEKDETPKFGSHIINVLLPEWILSLFIKRYEMKREEAIAHLKSQNIQHFRLVN